MNTKIHWISVHPTHYHSFLFENVGEMDNIDLTVYYENDHLVKYPWSKKEKIKSFWEYSITNLKKKIIRLVPAINSKENSLFIINGWASTYLFLLIPFLAIKRYPIIIWTDTPRENSKRGYAIGLLRRIWLLFIFKHAYKVFGTGEIAVGILEKMGCKKDKLVNFPFTTNLEYFKPSPTTNRKEIAVQLISSGRLDLVHKGYNVALKAVATLKNEGYKLNYRIAGEGPDRDKIERLIEDLELWDSVELLGWLEADELISFYQSADYFIHPSNFDPFPNAVLEAMACGLIVIGSNHAGSVVERIDDSSGFVFQAGNSIDLYNRMKSAIGLTQEQISQMKLKARSVAEQWSVQYHKSVITSVCRGISDETNN